MNIGIIYLVIMAFCASSYSAAQKLTSQFFSPIISLLISNVVVFVLGGIILLYQKTTDHNILITPQKVIFPIMVGLFATGIEYFAVLAFSKKVPFNMASVITGSIGVLLTVLYGKFIFQEGVTPLRISALVLAAISTFLVSISF